MNPYEMPANDQTQVDALLVPKKPVSRIDLARDALGATEEERSIMSSLMIFSIMLMLRTLGKSHADADRITEEVIVEHETKLLNKVRAYKAGPGTQVEGSIN